MATERRAGLAGRRNPPNRSARSGGAIRILDRPVKPGHDKGGVVEPEATDPSRRGEDAAPQDEASRRGQEAAPRDQADRDELRDPHGEERGNAARLEPEATMRLLIMRGTGRTPSLRGAERRSNLDSSPGGILDCFAEPVIGRA